VSDSSVGFTSSHSADKFAEHLTGIDEAWDNQMDLALAHVLGATIQTSLFNAPLVVLVGWRLGLTINLSVSIFNIVVLILTILVVAFWYPKSKQTATDPSTLGIDKQTFTVASMSSLSTQIPRLVVCHRAQ